MTTEDNGGRGGVKKKKKKELTELDTRVVLTDLVALLVGEEHVGGEAALGGVGVCWSSG